MPKRKNQRMSHDCGGTGEWKNVQKRRGSRFPERRREWEGGPERGPIEERRGKCLFGTTQKTTNHGNHRKGEGSVGDCLIDGGQTPSPERNECFLFRRAGWVATIWEQSERPNPNQKKTNCPQGFPRKPRDRNGRGTALGENDFIGRDKGGGSKGDLETPSYRKKSA